MTADALRCRACGSEMVAGRFCGTCGATQAHRRGDGADWLRIRHHCPAPGQTVLRPSPVSTLFPQLSPSSRRAFGLGFVIMLATLTALVLLRWQAPAIGVAVLGFPLLLSTYLGASHALRPMPRWCWILSIVLGSLFGVAWALLTGVWVVRNYGVGFGAGVAGGPNGAALGVPIGAVIVMTLPTLIVRLIDTRPARVLDGLVIGVLGATSFGVSATVVRLIPQLATGLVARHRPLEGLLVESGIRGVVIPMTSAAIGGVAGVALWFARRGGGVRRRRPLIAAGILVAVTVAGGNALADTSRLGPPGELILHFAVTLVALYGLRIALHLALLHETRAESTDAHVDCSECGRLLQGLPFCPSCGRASSTQPSPVAISHERRPVLRFAAGLTAAGLGATAVSLILSKPVAVYACPPECGSPPIGTAVKINPRFTAADGAFSVAYPEEGSAYDVVLEPAGVVATLNRGDGGVLRLFGEPARGRDAQQVVHDFLADAKPKAARAYSLPNATVGYQLGYGEVDDDYPVSATGGYVRLRVVSVAAVKNDYALIAAAIGPFHRFGPDFGPGPPSAVNLQLALDMDSYVNSFRWRGDPDD